MFQKRVVWRKLWRQSENVIKCVCKVHVLFEILIFNLTMICIFFFAPMSSTLISLKMMSQFFFCIKPT